MRLKPIPLIVSITAIATTGCIPTPVPADRPYGPELQGDTITIIDSVTKRPITGATLKVGYATAYAHAQWKDNPPQVVTYRLARSDSKGVAKIESEGTWVPFMLTIMTLPWESKGLHPYTVEISHPNYRKKEITNNADDIGAIIHQFGTISLEPSPAT